MIVVDTNIIAYFWLPGKYSESVKNLYKKDSEWLAPFLWRSEFRSILTLYIRKGLLKKNDAIEIIINAENMLKGNEYSIDSTNLIEKVTESNLSAYDLEFVVLAEMMKTKLATFDKEIIKQFPKLILKLKN